MKWRTLPLSALGAVQTGSTPSTSEERFWGGDIPFVTPAELEQRTPVYNTPRTLTIEGGREGRLLREGAVMVCCIGSLGKIGIAGRELVTNQQINSVEFDPQRIFPKYGYYACHRLKSKLIAMAPATTVPIVNKSKFGQLEIPVPPLPEQIRIAAILDKADALRVKRREALEQLDTLAQAVLLELLDNCDELGSIPLEKIVRDMHQGINTVTEEIEYQVTGYPIIQSKHTTQGYLDLTDARFVSEATFSKYRDKYKPAKNDLLLCNIGTIGSSILLKENVDFLIAWNLFLIKFDHNQVEPCYCKYFFDYLVRGHYFDKFLTGGTVKFISKKTLSATPIKLPPIHVQRVFAQKVSSIEAVKSAQSESLAELDSLFSSLQHRAFRGEL